MDDGIGLGIGVLSQNMRLQIVGPQSFERTVRTRVGEIDGRMNEGVSLQALVQGEFQAAYLANERFVVIVREQMQLHVLFSGAGVLASRKRAAEELARVHQLMSSQSLGVHSAESAFVAQVFLLVGMYQEVTVQAVLPFEAFVAEGTRVRRLFGVPGQMLAQ